MSGTVEASRGRVLFLRDEGYLVVSPIVKVQQTSTVKNKNNS